MLRTLGRSPGRSIRHPPWRVLAVLAFAAALVVVALLVTGFEVTARVIECPADGSSGGSWNGIVTGGFTWDCVEGQVQFK